MSYPERLALRREIRGTANLLACLIVFVAAISLAGTQHPDAGAALTVVAAITGWRARHQFNLAGRARIGVAAERRTETALETLAADGWKVLNNVPLPGNGDIDHVAIAPGGLTFIIETKARRYTTRHLARTRRAAEHFSRGPRRSIQTVPVLTSAGAGATRVEDGVIVCATNALTGVLQEQWRAHRHAA